MGSGHKGQGVNQRIYGNSDGVQNWNSRTVAAIDLKLDLKVPQEYCSAGYSSLSFHRIRRGAYSIGFQALRAQFRPAKARDLKHVNEAGSEGSFKLRRPYFSLECEVQDVLRFKFGGHIK